MTSVKKTGPIIVALSGGVDSAAAAAILKKRGYDVIGVHLILYEGGGARKSRQKAGEIAGILGIPLREIDLRADFRSTIVDPFFESYRRGLTPNPCVVCNPKIKFASLLGLADQENASWIATGHYVRIVDSPDGLILCRGKDPARDQSYFLYRLPGQWLSKIVFPLGDLTKEEVRRTAEAWVLPVARGEESREVCFLEGKDYREVLKKDPKGLGPPGLIVDRKGKILGHHQGVGGYTVGQRRGLGLGGGPWYVAAIDPVSGTVTLDRSDQRFRAGCRIRETVWIAGHPPGEDFRAEIMIRYRQHPVRGRCRFLGENRWQLEFKTPKTGVAPGQSAVLYRGPQVLGGGTIEGSE